MVFALSLVLFFTAPIMRGPASPHPVPPPAVMPAPVCEPGTPCKLHGR
jgi:hypothetical protein